MSNSGHVKCMLARNIPEKKRKMNSEEMPETMCESSIKQKLLVIASSRPNQFFTSDCNAMARGDL
jgi:hypothetical protein